jgi:hypothetical protein
MYERNAVPVAPSATDIHIHGWDSTGWFWHEVDGVEGATHHSRSVLRKLSKAPAGFSGRCRVHGSPVFEFQTTAFDLSDSGLAIVHSEGSSDGPVGALTILPAHRRSLVRSEFAFGFVAHLSFLYGLINPASEPAVYDYVDNLLRTDQTSTLVITVETARDSSDINIVLSKYLEELSISMLQWLRAKDELGGHRDGMPHTRVPGDAPSILN